jgi:hypothetical protein
VSSDTQQRTKHTKLGQVARSLSPLSFIAGDAKQARPTPQQQQ